jgi:hypothetical protein
MFQPHAVGQRALAETHHHRVEEALALVGGEALEVRARAHLWYATVSELDGDFMSRSSDRLRSPG